MRLLVSASAAALLAATVLAPTAGAQERANPPRQNEREPGRREAEQRARRRALEVAPRAEALTRAFTFRAGAPDRAVIGVAIGEGSERGVRVESVTEGSPAARAGIATGDYLTRVQTRTGDVPLRLDAADAADPVMRAAVTRRLTRALDDLKAGDEVTLGVAGERGGERTVRVTTVRADSLQPEGMVPGAMSETMRWRMDGDRATLGMSLAPSGTARDTLGAFVASVVPGGPAERAGVYEGQRIAAINGTDLRVAPADVEDDAVAASRAARLERAMRDVEAGQEVTLRVWDGRAYRDVRVRSAKASEVYEGRPFGGMPMLEALPGGAGWRMMVPPAPPTLPAPAVAPRAPRAPGAPMAPRAPRAARLRVAPRAFVAPPGEVRVIVPARARWI